MNDHTPTHRTNGAFVTWDAGDEKGKLEAVAVASQAYQEMSGIYRTRAATGLYRNISDPNTSVREGFDRRDYDYFRPGERIPVEDKRIIDACMQAYRRFGVVQNIIDLMADFACKGIDIVHPSPRVQKLYQDWFKRVNGPERTERILNMFYRAGNVIVRRGTAVLPDLTMDVLRTDAADHEIKPSTTIPSGEIPWQYTVMDPRSIEVLGGELATLIGPDGFIYALKLPDLIARKIKSPRTQAEKALVKQLPDYVIGAAYGDRLIPLPKDKIAVIYYKKDDAEIWAKPLLYSLLDPLSLLNKMRQADRAALDGAIQHIRLWKLGNIQERILPSKEGIRHLSDILLNNTGGGTMDLIWGPELELQETSTDVHHFLGQEKYVPVLNEIFAGLGVPPTLTGTVGGSSGGFTNNFVSLKTLTERLEYGRMMVAMFWQNEMSLVQKAFGFRQPATLVFDSPSLTDDDAGKKLFIELADRNMVSVEFLQEKFGAIPEIETVRLRREAQARQNGNMPPAAGPFHLESQQKDFLARVFAQTGAVTPEEVGLELQERKPGTKAPAEILSKLKQQEIASKPTTTSTKPKRKAGGRPVGTKDTSKRKAKTVQPRSKAHIEYARAFIWAEEAQQAIAEITQPAFLGAKKKKNMRAVSSKEAEEFENFKFSILCRFQHGEKVDEEAVKAAMESNLAIPGPVMVLYRDMLEAFREKEGRDAPVEKVRQIQAAVYAMYSADFDAVEAGSV